MTFTTRSFLRTTVFAAACAMAVPAGAGGLLGGGMSGSLGGSLGGTVGGLGATGMGTISGTGSVTSPDAIGPATRVTRTVKQSAVPATPSVAAVTTQVTIPDVPDVQVRRAAIVSAGIAPVPYAEVPVYVDHQYIVLQDELRGTGVRVKKEGQQIILEMPSDVTFAFNKYDIQPRFHGVLNAVSRTLEHYPATYVDVNGHTDAIGSYGYNQVLSEKRAGSVADYLADRGVNPGRMHTEGFGKTEPIASNATIEGRAANRRVEIVLTPYAS